MQKHTNIPSPQNRSIAVKSRREYTDWLIFLSFQISCAALMVCWFICQAEPFYQRFAHRIRDQVERNV